MKKLICAAIAAAFASAVPAANAQTGPSLIAAGAYHACSGSSSAIYCWGSNSAGELGDGTTTQRLQPVKVKNLPTPILELAASYDRTVALTGSGVYQWGRQAKVNNGKWVASSTPTKVSNVPSGAHGLSVGVKQGCVLDGSGIPWCWGMNGNGEVADGTTQIRTKAVKTKFAASVQIAASDGYTLVRLASGGVAGMGVSHGGDNGDPLNPPGQVVNSTTAVQTIPGLETATSISATGDFALALLADGTVMGWGEDDHYQLGDGSHAGRSTPLPVPGVAGIVQIQATANHGVALDANGSVFAWGRGDHGQMGNGTTADQPFPGLVSLPVSVSRIVGGASGHFTLAVAVDSTGWAWGRNQNGALDDGSTVDRPVPVQVTFPQ